jgi:hypothetical protein
MNDARRYRLNAAECLSAANTCHSDHRSLLLSIAGSWYALARQDEATRDLLASWGMAEPMTLNGLDRRPSSGPSAAPSPEPQRPTATLPT